MAKKWKKCGGCYNIWLGNPWKLKYDWQGLCQRVANLFAPAARLAGYTNARCRSTYEAAPVLSNTELLIYVVKNRKFGLVERHFCESRGDVGGMTSPVGRIVGAEVYLEEVPNQFTNVSGKYTQQQVANLIYHEALHVKTGLGDQLHNLRIRNGGGGLALADPADRTLTSDNTRLMGNHLNDSQEQWRGGWDVLDSTNSETVCAN